MTQAEREAIGAALHRIETRTGRLDPEEVVRVAQAKNHPLHGYFEWDDRAAGHQYRIVQAVGLIRRVLVEQSFRDTVIMVPAYVRDLSKQNDERGYIATVALKDQEELAREALVYAASTAAGHLQRVRDLAVAFNLENEVDEILARFEAFQQMLQPT